jgi:hypothetical protein
MFDRWGTMPQSIKYAFRLQLAGLNPLKCSGSKTRFTAIIVIFMEHVKGFRPANHQQKSYSFAWCIISNQFNVT